MFYVLWFVSIVASFFMGRWIVTHDDEKEFENDLIFTIIFIVAGFVPFVNIFTYFATVLLILHQENKYSNKGTSEKIINKVFFIKKDGDK